MKMNLIAAAVAAAMLSLSAAAQDPKKPMDDKDKAPQTSAPGTKPADAATGATAKAKKPGKPMEADKEKEKKQ